MRGARGGEAGRPGDKEREEGERGGEEAARAAGRRLPGEGILSCLLLGPRE